jgi:hypothetical protein
VNAGFHVRPNGCGLINGLTILLAMPSRLIEVLSVSAELELEIRDDKFSALAIGMLNRIAHAD